MKKFTITIALFAFCGLATYALAPNPEKREFKTTHYDINLELERTKGEVMFHFLSQNFNDFDQIIIERSGTSLEGFTPCKVIDMKSQELIDGSYMINKDRFPYPASVDSYYRIKTIAKDGVTKTYAPVQLQSLHN